MQTVYLLLVKAEDEGAVVPEGEIQLFGKLGHHFAAADIEPCLQRPGDAVEAGVDDGGISLAGALADVALTVNDAAGETVSHQFSCDGTPRRSRADDDNIIHSIIPFVYQKDFDLWVSPEPAARGSVTL